MGKITSRKGITKKTAVQGLQHKAGEVTRRKFLRGAGTSVAGLAVMGTAGLVMKNTATATQATPKTLPYVKLDPEKAMKRAYEGYSKGG
ncbi:MAG: hypothetical protein R6V15_10045 [Desulfotignum sp.]